MRVVVKVGTSTLAHSTGRLNIKRVEKLCKVLSDIKNAGYEIILVSSGAIAMGFGKLNLPSRPTEASEKQACAAIGQCELMYVYDKLFAEYNHIVGQILITGHDIETPERRTYFENTLYKMLDYGVLPIINENDTVSTEELGIGDNDTLSAIVANCVNADLLVLMSDIDGLYDKSPKDNPDAKVISRVDKITPEIMALCYGKGTLGTGGMATKLEAAKTVTANGCDMVITNGAKPEALYDIVEGKNVGTRFIKEYI